MWTRHAYEDLFGGKDLGLGFRADRQVAHLVDNISNMAAPLRLMRNNLFQGSRGLLHRTVHTNPKYFLSNTPRCLSRGLLGNSVAIVWNQVIRAQSLTRGQMSVNVKYWFGHNWSILWCPKTKIICGVANVLCLYLVWYIITFAIQILWNLMKLYWAIKKELLNTTCTNSDKERECSIVGSVPGALYP